jgi:DNA primase
MEHEHLSYPEALRYLARKYAIEVVEEQRTPEQEAETSRREAIFLTLAYAQRTLSDNLWNTDEGRSIGLGYFRERGFRDDIIDRFQLGYSFDRSTAFTDRALHDQHKKEPS